MVRSSTDDNDPIDDELELQGRRWFHRRSIAKKSFNICCGFVLIFIGIGLIAEKETVANLSEFNAIFVTFVGGLLSLTGAYMGLSTWKGEN